MKMEKKKATDLTTSASTDMNQSLNLNNNIITSAKTKSNENILETLSLNEIYDTVFTPRKEIIEGMLYSGAYLFAGAPKVGKSFFMAQLGYCISKGLPLWDFKVNGGAVLYLALEDDFSRIQKRLSTMFGDEDNENFHFATRSKNLTEGLEEQLCNFLVQHPDTKLIIIDTLQKVREKGGEKFSYSSDYDIASALKEFADMHNICVLVVHHTRKQQSEDSFDDVSGTNGLLGAVDGAFIMVKPKRVQNSANIDIAGRDVQNMRLKVSFDGEKCLWNLDSIERNIVDKAENPLLLKLSSFLTDEIPSWCGTASELIERLRLDDISPNVLTRRLNVLANELFNRYGITLGYKRTHTERLIILERIEKT